MYVIATYNRTNIWVPNNWKINIRENLVRQEVTVKVMFLGERRTYESKRKAALVVEGKENDQLKVIFNHILFNA